MPNLLKRLFTVEWSFLRTCSTFIPATPEIYSCKQPAKMELRCHSEGPSLAGCLRRRVMSTAVQRRFPIGAELSADGAHFRVWAPRRRLVEVALDGADSFELERETDGYFSRFITDVRSGALYQFRLDHAERLYPDPASRFQTGGPHGPSQLVDSSTFHWTDQGWGGVRLHGQVIYEIHVGTFTGEGTWKAAERQLPELAETGVTLLEVMPAAEFSGTFGWGYDG